MYVTTVTKIIKCWPNVQSQSIKQEVYYPLALFMGCGVVERLLEMAKPTKKIMQFESNKFATTHRAVIFSTNNFIVLVPRVASCTHMTYLRTHSPRIRLGQFRTQKQLNFCKPAAATGTCTQLAMGEPTSSLQSRLSTQPTPF